METMREKNAKLSERFEETETKIRVLSEEKEIQAHNASRDIEDLTTEHAKLADRHERTVAELRAVTQEKEEIARQLEKAKEDAGLLQIPSTDVRMTKIKLGEGAYGEVRVGYWRGSPVAVKKFFSCLETDYYIRLFEQEISICSRARHPNIVFMCGVTTENGTPLQIITELLEGSLSDVIKAALRSQCALSLREQIDLALGISAGVSYLHQLGPDGVLHGDIRSSNVVVTSLMEAKICDLGAAHFAEVSLSAGPLSPEYLAPERSPERRRGSLRNTKMADVYSMGVTLIELMTGQQPVASCRFQQASDVRHPLVKEIFLRMINVDPTFRPTAHECLALLEQVRQSDVYNRCPRKRMVRGKFHGESQNWFQRFLPLCELETWPKYVNLSERDQEIGRR
ncbi:probable serine/threonine-protein kinase DDB_G0271682 [Oscarella lobularis]|uniref:probable serine/threonine-protein kinase DDB_G0271682 n=1 Tax=Oscarella lobularis TaxID=121494 RepID=UPI0033134E23